MHWYSRVCGGALFVLMTIGAGQAGARFGTFFRDQAGQYFEKVEDPYAPVTIPPPCKNPEDAVSVAPRQLKGDFAA